MRKQLTKKLIIFFIILLISLTVACSSTKLGSYVPEDEKAASELAPLYIEIKTLVAYDKYPESTQPMAEKFQTYAEKDKEIYNLREKSESFLLYNQENPSTKGVLLIHGLGASPNEMRILGEFLYENGFTVLGVRLAGHGAGLDTLEKRKWNEWYRSAKFGYDVLDYLTEETYVIGISTGGSLGLLLAKDKEFDSLITIAPAVKMKSWKLNFIPIAKYFVRYEDRDLDEEEKITYDEKLPTETIHELLKMIDATKPALEEVTEPLLILQATNDPRLKKSNIQYVYDHVGTPKTQIEKTWIESDEHVILKGDTQDEVFEEILEFIS